MSLCSFSYLSNNGTSTGCAAIEPEPTSVSAPAEAGTATAKAAVSVTAKVFTFMYSVLSMRRAGDSFPRRGGDASTFPPLLIDLVGKDGSRVLMPPEHG